MAYRPNRNPDRQEHVEVEDPQPGEYSRRVPHRFLAVSEASAADDAEVRDATSWSRLGIAIRRRNRTRSHCSLAPTNGLKSICSCLRKEVGVGHRPRRHREIEEDEEIGE